MEKKWISLNVGGTYFLCNRSTLMRGTPVNSPLHRIASSSTNVTYDRDEKGAYFIDRDPQYFQVILNFLRTRRLIIPQNIPEESILYEAEYFGMPELLKAVANRISSSTLPTNLVNQSRCMLNWNPIMNPWYDANSVTNLK